MTVMVLYQGSEFRPLAFKDGEHWKKVKSVTQKWTEPQGHRLLYHFVIVTEDHQIWEMVYLQPDGYWKGWWSA
ncbi:hypothetical protein HPY42_00625 [Coprothermobacteraceae bacterium]|nr:hypothetical protein [Coprothermobacteraceae bacterium]